MLKLVETVHLINGQNGQQKTNVTNHSKYAYRKVI